ncbi:stage II sporulation protein E [Leptospira ryugenii]|uniref:Stage II sporulation protein E n=1 Tax=Leptospira ryugenii TaxID=1917863 RepID=A0A2P2E3S4_9LEPT|nr:PP2C family protein-serine/threonine phosphatase [Leptospira ryugenii]GBF51484.1 stage II sporulation protein E [Leptospira ryugenii]
MKVKRKYTNKKRKILWGYILFCLCLLLPNCHFESIQTARPSIDLFQEDTIEYLWLPSDSDKNHPQFLAKETFAVFEKGKLGGKPNPNHKLWIRIRKPQKVAFSQPVLFLEIALEKMKVFEGNELIYTFSETDYVFPHIIPLSADKEGFIYIEFDGIYRGFLGIDRSAWILEHQDAYHHMFIQNFFRICLGPVLVFLSLLFFGMYFLNRSLKMNLFFSAFLMSCAWIEITNGFIAYFWQNQSQLVSTIQYVNYALCPLMLLLFLAQVFPPFFGSLFRLISCIHVVLYIVYFLRNDSDPVSFLNIEEDFSLWLVPEAIIVIYSSIYVIFRKQKHLTLISVGIIIFIFTGIHDVLVDLEILPYRLSLIHLGLWIGVVAFAYFVFKQYFQMIQSMDQMNQLLIQKNKDLERLIAIDRDLDLAHTLQESLLAKREIKESLIHIKSFNQALHSVGGDYFDFTQDSMGNWGIIICDVAGHGISSAFVAAMTKMAFSATAPYMQFPQKVLHSMNRNLTGKVSGLFITSSYLYFDLEAKLLSFSNAGHPEFYLIRNTESEIREVRAKGKPLGLFNDLSYQENKLELLSGDRIFLYTDGLLDLVHPDEGSFEESKLKSILWQNRELPLDQFESKMLEEIKRYTIAMGEPEDDISFLMIEVT